MTVSNARAIQSTLKMKICGHVLKPGTPEHRNTGTAEKPRNSEFDGVVLFSHLQTMLKI